MPDLSILTVTYAPDLEPFMDLHDSVMRFTDPAVIHEVIVDDADLELFSRFEGPRCRIHAVSRYVPRSFIRVPRAKVWVNLRRPWPPVRGWVLQQLIKLEAVARNSADVVLLMDSDVALVRPVTVENFRTDGLPHFFRLPSGVHEGMDRHVLWHQVARRMLGVAGSDPPFNDYVDSFNVWSPALVRGLCRRVESITRRPWQDAFAANLHVSEFILYGVHIDEVLGARAPVHVVNHLGCHNYWDEVELDRSAALSFADALGADDVAMMISAKSGTPAQVRREALARGSRARGSLRDRRATPGVSLAWA